MQRVRMRFLAAALAFCAFSAYGQTITTINGSPLKINVGSDGSFQIYNSAVPGVGQVFPTGSTLADMGLFAHIDGVLHAPNFRARGTATGALGTFTPWQQLGITRQPTGLGTAESPFVVSVGLGAPGTDVRVSMTISYVNGNNFFRVRSNFFSTTDTLHEIDATFGADIFLAASDNGIFVSVPELAAVGGRNCDPADGEYNILLIPITPATRFTTAHFSSVWAQIGANELDNNTASVGCIDNGAAIQWRNVMSGTATSVELSHAVSFGAIPSAANFHGFFIDVEPDFVTLTPGQSAKLTITSTHNAELEFNAPIHFSAGALPQGMTLTFDKTDVPAPGDGTVTATVSVDNSIFPLTYRNLAVLGSGGSETRAGFFGVEVLCTPPTILGISQPKTQTVARGSRATLSVKAEGGGSFLYQWYAGHAPITRFPISGATSASLQTEPINDFQQYWVRISNACGTVDSLTATVTPN